MAVGVLAARANSSVAAATVTVRAGRQSCRRNSPIRAISNARPTACRLSDRSTRRTSTCAAWATFFERLQKSGPPVRQQRAGLSAFAPADRRANFGHPEPGAEFTVPAGGQQISTFTSCAPSCARRLGTPREAVAPSSRRSLRERKYVSQPAAQLRSCRRLVAKPRMSPPAQRANRRPAARSI